MNMSQVKVSLSVALSVFIVSFLISLGFNTWITSLFRGIIGFVLFFLLMFPVQWIFQQVMSGVSLSSGTDETSVKNSEVEKKGDTDKGRHIDLSTPDDLEHGTNSNQEDFQPFNPAAQSASGPEKIDPEKVAKVLGHLSDD
ncbi:MAG: hypothetical protein H0Z33_03770 [Bacillaceae bacterium]|nr:hypothetical protein [Bacillaceae bacterium]